jgi:hypothetical protein
MQFAPGFVGPGYQRDVTGAYRAICEPSSAKVDFKVKAAVGKRLPPSGVPGPQANTRVEGSTRDER